METIRQSTIAQLQVVSPRLDPSRQIAMARQYNCPSTLVDEPIQTLTDRTQRLTLREMQTLPIDDLHTIIEGRESRTILTDPTAPIVTLPPSDVMAVELLRPTDKYRNLWNEECRYPEVWLHAICRGMNLYMRTIVQWLFDCKLVSLLYTPALKQPIAGHFNGTRRRDSTSVEQHTRQLRKLHKSI